jgi:hypothetical protein
MNERLSTHFPITVYLLRSTGYVELFSISLRWLLISRYLRSSWVSVHSYEETRCTDNHWIGFWTHPGLPRMFALRPYHVPLTVGWFSPCYTNLNCMDVPHSARARWWCFGFLILDFRSPVFLISRQVQLGREQERTQGKANYSHPAG